MLIPRDGGAIGPRVVAAAAAGAKAVLLYGDGPIANGALGLDDRVSIPVAVLPGYAGLLLAKAVDAGGDATVTFGRVDRTGERERWSGRRLLLHGSRLRRRAQARPRGAGRRHHELARRRRLRRRDGHVGLRSARSPATPRCCSRRIPAGPSTSCAARSWAPRPQPVRSRRPVSRSIPSRRRAAAPSIRSRQAPPRSSRRRPASASASRAATRSRRRCPLILQNVSDQPVSVHLGFVRDGVGDDGITADVTADQPELTIPANSSSTLHVTLSLTGLTHTASVIGGWVTVTTDGAQRHAAHPVGGCDGGRRRRQPDPHGRPDLDDVRARHRRADPPSQLQLQLGDVEAGLERRRCAPRDRPGRTAHRRPVPGRHATSGACSTSARCCRASIASA